MLRITVELDSAVTGRRSTLATAKVWNTAEGDGRTGYYHFVLQDKAGREWRSGEVRGFKRAEFTVWWLVALVLRIALPDAEKALR